MKKDSKSDSKQKKKIKVSTPLVIFTAIVTISVFSNLEKHRMYLIYGSIGEIIGYLVGQVVASGIVTIFFMMIVNVLKKGKKK